MHRNIDCRQRKLHHFGRKLTFVGAIGAISFGARVPVSSYKEDGTNLKVFE